MNKRTGSTRRWRKLRKEILERDEYKCMYCGDRANQVDHVTPIESGGDDQPSNLVAACQACNLRKGTKPARVFVEQMRKQKTLKSHFFDSPRTPPTPSPSVYPEDIGSPFERPDFERN